MRILTENEDTYDSDQCPYCKTYLGDLDQDVSDDDNRELGEDVASAQCPACNETIAVCREHTFYLAKFKPAPTPPPPV